MPVATTAARTAAASPATRILLFAKDASLVCTMLQGLCFPGHGGRHLSRDEGRGSLASDTRRGLRGRRRRHPVGPMVRPETSPLPANNHETITTIGNPGQNLDAFQRVGFR